MLGGELKWEVVLPKGSLKFQWRTSRWHWEGKDHWARLRSSHQRKVKVLLERPQAVRHVPPAWLLPEFDILQLAVGGCRSLKGGQKLGQLWMQQLASRERASSVGRRTTFWRRTSSKSCPWRRHGSWRSSRYCSYGTCGTGVRFCAALQATSGCCHWRFGEWDQGDFGGNHELFGILGVFWCETGQPVLSGLMWTLEAPASFVPLTSPDFFDEMVISNSFDSGKHHNSKTMKLGGATVLVWQPDEVIDDSTLASLDPSLGFLGMQEEVKNLNDWLKNWWNYDWNAGASFKEETGQSQGDTMQMGISFQVWKQSKMQNRGEGHPKRNLRKIFGVFESDALYRITALCFDPSCQQELPPVQHGCCTCIYAFTLSLVGKISA